jgi:Protein of unknown function (DUF2846)
MRLMVATRGRICLFMAWLDIGGVMLRWGVMLAAAALLSGCVSDGIGTDYAAIVQKVGPPRAGQSRIVVLQEKRQGLSMALCACDMNLDGSPIGKVTVGTYVYADRPAGRHQLMASETLFPGKTRREFSTQPGRTYYFLVRSSPRHDTVTGGAVIGCLTGILVTSVATAESENPGPAVLLPLDESAAKVTLAELQLVD